MKYTIGLFVCASCLTASAQSITGFGTDFTYEPGASSINSFIANPTNFTFAADGSGFLGGFITPVFSGANAVTQVQLTATINSFSLPSSVFFVDLYDAEFDFKSFQGEFSGYTLSLPATFLANFTSIDTSIGNGSFNGNVAAVGIRFGSASGSINITLDSLSAIPEPSSFAALFGVAAVGFATTRRRRRA